MLSFEKDVALCTRDFELGALTRLFFVANSEAALRKVAAEKHGKMPPRPASARARSPSPAVASKRSASPRLSRHGSGAAATGVDQQLNLYEFINFLVRVGFARANPSHGNAHHPVHTKSPPTPRCFRL